LKECPPAEDIYPCKCDLNREFWYYHGGIFCGGDQIFDMKKIFHRLSKTSKYVDSPYEILVFNNSKIVEIPEDILGNFTFKAIFFADPVDANGMNRCCDNLEKVNHKAFSSSFKTTQELNLFTKRLQTWKNPNPYSLIDLSNQFKNLTELRIETLIDLDDESFGKNLSSLKRLDLKVNSINGSPFKEMNDLEVLLLSGGVGTLDHISSNAFRFNNRKNNDTEFLLQLYFWSYDHLNGYSFEIGSLINFNTSVQINFSSNRNFKFLREIIFFPFFEKNIRNKLHLDGIDCNDCRNYWIFKKKDILEGRLTAFCNGDQEHGKIWENEDKFEHCK
jgi:hypothetical protein